MLPICHRNNSVIEVKKSKDHRINIDINIAFYENAIEVISLNLKCREGSFESFRLSQQFFRVLFLLSWL